MSRHHSLADAMSALMAYKNRPEGDLVPIQTNWSLVPANDNEQEDVADMGYERIQLTTPSVAEIMKQVKTKDIERNAIGQVVRIGRLRFSEGTQVEAGFKLGPGGEVTATKHRMPAGAMLGGQDRPHTTIGGEQHPTERTASNNYFIDLFKVPRRQRVAAKKRAKKNGKGFSRSEAQAMLAEAYANTKQLPVVKICPPGLPAASDRIADNFIGMRKGTKGESGSTVWQDVSTAIVDREIWMEVMAELLDGDRQVLDRALSAKKMSSILPGGHRRTAERRGKRLLCAANDNLSTILKKISV